MLDIQNLRVAIQEEQKTILNDISLKINQGEVHAIMGPNGSGKSTTASVLAGKEGYEVLNGDILFEGQSILELEPEERAHLGLFLAFQYPVEIPGVQTLNFLKTAVNETRTARGLEPLEGMDFLKLVRQKTAALKIDEAMLKRSVNVGFSGGEKKRAEVLQMALLEPKLAVLDETDSGLDIDALKVVADGVNALRDGKRSFLVITHYQRLLDYIRPDVVHVLSGGKIVKTGGPELALELEAHGYAAYQENA